jgi:hypothetical protein
MNLARVLLLLSSAAVCLFPIRTAIATEGGGTSKALGVDNVLAGVIPPPGALQLENFVVYYGAGHTLDSSGNDRPFIRNFDLSIWAEVLRVRYVLPGITFLGANVETRVGYTFLTDIDVNFDRLTSRGPIHLHDDTTNTGDGLLGLILGWHWKNFHQMVGPEFFLPLGYGHYHPTALANISRNYVSIGPSYWFTWFPVERLEVSGALIYLINLENPDTHYESGNELSFDYNVAYQVVPDVQIGINGYAYKQLEDDEMRGHVVNDGNRGQVVAFGPLVRWAPHGKRYGITLKWQHEEAVENRTQGDRFILQARIQF